MDTIPVFSPCPFSTSSPISYMPQKGINSGLNFLLLECKTHSNLAIYGSSTDHVFPVVLKHFDEHCCCICEKSIQCLSENYFNSGKILPCRDNESFLYLEIGHSDVFYTVQKIDGNIVFGEMPPKQIAETKTFLGLNLC